MRARLVVQTTDERHVPRVYHLVQHLIGRHGLGGAVGYGAAGRTVTATGEVFELLYLLRTHHGFGVHLRAGRVEFIKLEPVKEDGS